MSDFNEQAHPRETRTGKFTVNPNAEGAATAVTDQAWLTVGRGASDEVGGDQADAIVPGATLVRIEPGWDGKLRADITFKPTDVRAQLAELYSNLDDPDERNLDDFLQVHGKRINRIAREYGIERKGPWEDSTITYSMGLPDAESTTLAAVKRKADEDWDVRDLSSAASGMPDALTGLRDSLMENSCSLCFASLEDGEGYDGLCGDHADQACNEDD